MSKNVGIIAETKFVFECSKLGITVSQPFGDNAPYDFIIDIEGVLSRVQVKTLRKLDSGVYTFKTHSSVAHRGRSNKSYKGLVDFYFAYNEEDDIYVFVPIDDTSDSDFRLRSVPSKNNQTSGVNWIKDYSRIIS